MGNYGKSSEGGDVVNNSATNSTAIREKCYFEVVLPNAKHFQTRNFRLPGNFIPLYSLFNLVAHINGGK